MPPKIVVPTGYVSHELTFIEELPGYKCKCLCSCGKEVVLAKCNFTSGHTKSCGHLNKDNPPRMVHGRTAKGQTDGTWVSWRKMLERIRYPHLSPHYVGISICDRWEPRQGGSFKNFIADMGERPEGMSLDRINPSGNYEPSNCRWATPLEQSQNRRAWKHTPEGLARINANRRK
jgi:hypothetical protein